MIKKGITLPESFPPIPSTTLKIHELFASSKIDNEELVSLLQSDPFLCATMLKMANSPFYARSQAITSINHAISILGLTMVRGMVMAAALRTNYPSDLTPYGLTVESLTAVALQQSQLFKCWYKDDNATIRHLESAIFLMESGKLILSDLMTKQGFNEIFIYESQKLGFDEAELDICGMTSFVVASLLFQSWNYGHDFCDRLAKIGHPTTTDEAILTAIHYAIPLNGRMDQASKEKALQYIDQFELPKQTFLDAYEQMLQC